VQNIPNRNDSGALSGITNRLVTGLLTTGTAANPVLFVTSSDPGIADSNVDTNSSTISKLTWNGTNWDHQIVVQGLPRSRDDHAANGMALEESTNTLYVAQGGNTNKGATSSFFGFLPEYALAAAVLAVDLDAIGTNTYNIPTLTNFDTIVPGNIVGNPEPFGGQSGANMAIWDVAGPIDIFATGFRNPYDLVLTSDGLYVTDNGPNVDVGLPGSGLGVNNTCTAVPDTSAPDITQHDQLHFVTYGYHGGHPNPTLGNPTLFPGSVRGAPPFSLDQACDYQPSGTDSSPGPGGGIAVISGSTNGIAEYTASNFGGAMQGDLLMMNFNGSAYRAKPDGTGGLIDLGTPTNGPEDEFFTGLSNPLDVATTGDDHQFPGLIVIAQYGADNILFFEPDDFTLP
jgi:hypothetical protein